ncbi:MAG: aminopeptidase P family protein [Candidatus Saccharimonadales bacterium]
MKSHFTSEFFAGNRARLRDLFQGTAPIVIAANGLLQRGGDSSYAFAQDANFWYLTGIDEPDLVLVLDRDKQYLIAPERSVSRQAFDGAIDDESLSQRSGIREIYAGKQGWDMLSARLEKVKHVATLAPAPAYVEQYGLYTNPARAQLLERIKAVNQDIEVLDLSSHLTRMRMVKQAPEIAAIQAAIDLTLATIKTVCRPTQLARYAHEYEVEADISRGFRRGGAAGHAFEPIVASGARAVTLHNVANDGPLSAKDLLIMDVGAEVEHYAADITRTISLGTPTKRQRVVHAAVYDVQAHAMGLLKPGVLLRDYEQDIEHYMGEKLRELGLIKTINHDAVRTYYPHATSHYLGLNVHDAGEYDRPLEPGVVLTVEPGIYIAAEGIGVRIEDDVLITENGIEVLSRRLSGELG